MTSPRPAGAPYDLHGVGDDDSRHGCRPPVGVRRRPSPACCTPPSCGQPAGETSLDQAMHQLRPGPCGCTELAEDVPQVGARRVRPDDVRRATTPFAGRRRAARRPAPSSSGSAIQRSPGPRQACLRCCGSRPAFGESQRGWQSSVPPSPGPHLMNRSSCGNWRIGAPQLVEVSADCGSVMLTQLRLTYRWHSNQHDKSSCRDCQIP